jgi:hypothetical protein
VLASEDFTLQEGEYIIIPCTLHRGVQSKYNLVVYSEKEIIFELITEVPVALAAKVSPSLQCFDDRLSDHI